MAKRRRKVKRKARRKVKRKRKTARRKPKTASRRVKVTPKQYKQFEKMEHMYHYQHPPKGKRFAFGLILLAIAILAFFGYMNLGHVLGILAIFVLVKAFFDKKCC